MEETWRRPMSDRESFGHLINNLKQARDAARGIALTRPDFEIAAGAGGKGDWLQIAANLQRMADLAEKLFTTSVAKRLAGH